MKNESNKKQKIFKKSKSDDALNQTNDKTEIVQNDQSKKLKSSLDSEKNTDLNENKSTRIVSNNTELNYKNPKDSIALAEIIENPLDKILKEKQAKEKIEEKPMAEKLNKWKVRPNVAPMFMNASGGSPIHEIFGDNKKDYENNLSIGLGVDYALSNKFSVRTGVNKFDLGYNTNDIVFYADLSAKNTISKNNPIQTINMKGDAQNMVIEDKKTGKSNELATQSKDEGYLNQRFGYFEIPVEVSYKLIDKKFGIQIITGLSTLFLNNNQVSIVSAGRSTILGEANNLNKIHFSSNIGLGFKYSFWKSFEANFEPTFKYQINTFNDNSGNFNPYLVGLYSGISYRF
ncbi:outer membrane beta-barrel protein [Flavobacterium sp.]